MTDDIEEEVVESVFSEHWSKLADLLSDDARLALENHLNTQPTKTPAATPAVTPREAVVEVPAEVGKVVASHNSEFGRLDYWEKRFEVEEEYDYCHVRR